jgi:hypothetical protein
MVRYTYIALLSHVCIRRDYTLLYTLALVLVCQRLSQRLCQSLCFPLARYFDQILQSTWSIDINPISLSSYTRTYTYVCIPSNMLKWGGGCFSYKVVADGQLCTWALSKNKNQYQTFLVSICILC